MLEKINSPEELKKLNLEQLKTYASEVREFILQTVGKNGGHLASNLGAVELSIALHYTFCSPSDKIIWDVGHQSYTHKLITGRFEALKKLRTNEGASGFPCVGESVHDVFTSGHSSNSLSLAAGLIKARDLCGQKHRVISVIGDGAFTGGMVYEALNDIGESQANAIIILNDNKMSISRNVGAISKYFAKLRLSLKYNKIKQNVKKSLSSLPFSSNFEDDNDNWRLISSVKARLRSALAANKLFENFGITYYGPFDGHNIAQMHEIFKKAALKNKPILIHLITQKGKGCESAEYAPDKFHGLSACADPVIAQNGTIEESFSDVLGKTLIEMANQDDRVVAVTAAMPSGTGLDEYAKQFPTRYFDVSIAEQHAATACAGLAAGGMRPFFAVYSTFLQRAFDQILHDVCINNLPVTFVVDRAGAVGSDGITHQGIFDLSYLGAIPNMTIASPKDGVELRNLLFWAKDFGAPLAIRYPKSYYINNETSFSYSPIELGKWEWINKADSKIFILAVGNRMIDLAMRVQKNIDVNVVNSRFIKPLDESLLDKINQENSLIITLEDNIQCGGFGSSVLNYCNKSKGKSGALIKTLSHQNSFLDNRSIDESLKSSHLTEQNIISVIDGFLASR